MSNDRTSAHAKRRFYTPYVGLAFGAVAGFLFWRFIGCNTGMCPLTSNPYVAVGAGAFVGFGMGAEPGNKK